MVSDWVRLLSGQLATLVIGLWSLLALAVILAVGWFGWRTLFRLAESRFWALNSVVVQPGYATCREVLRHIAERLFGASLTPARRARLRSLAALLAGLMLCALALLLLWLVLPHAQFFGSIAEISSWRELLSVALANSIVLVMAYLGSMAVLWGIADALMPPRAIFAASIRAPPTQNCGASRTSPTCMSSASPMATALKAAAPARAATIASSACSGSWRSSTRRRPSMRSSSPAI